MKILKTPFLRSQEKKVDIITHITNAHKYIADAKKMFLFWPHTGLRKFNYYAA